MWISYTISHIPWVRVGVMLHTWFWYQVQHDIKGPWMTTFRRKSCLKKFKTQSLPWTMDNDNASIVKIKLCTFDLRSLRSKIQLSNDMHPLLSSSSQIKILKYLLSQPWHSPTIILCYMILIWNISRFIHMWIFQTKIRSQIKTNK